MMANASRFARRSAPSRTPPNIAAAIKSAFRTVRAASPRELQLQVKIAKTEKRIRSLESEQFAAAFAGRLMKRVEGNLLNSPTRLSQRIRGIR
jgi:hypothetical protein